MGLVYWDRRGQLLSRSSAAVAIAALLLAVVLNLIYW